MTADIFEQKFITMAHGAGGEATAQLIEQLFLEAFDGEQLINKEDQARLELSDLTKDGDRLAFTTDCYVVSPIHFPGGDIGKLAVCGTINDLAVGGAIPKYLSAGFILEEGLAISELGAIVQSMADTAKKAGVRIVTGDTKVVERGQADKIFINTSGVGVIPHHINVKIDQARAGDAILVNGYVGDHGAAILLARDELGITGDLQSDCAPLHDLIKAVLDICPNVRSMRDATRGGIATVLCEISKASNATIELSEDCLPIRQQTQAICELLGMDPLYLANEGTTVFIIPEEDVERVLTVMHQHPQGMKAACIGRVLKNEKPLLYIKTRYGSKRILDIPYGVQLPRIC